MGKVRAIVELMSSTWDESVRGEVWHAARVEGCDIKRLIQMILRPYTHVRPRQPSRDTTRYNAAWAARPGRGEWSVEREAKAGA